MNIFFNYLGLSALFLLSRLPITWAQKFGEFIGWLATRLPLKRRLVVERNLELCFPDLSLNERQLLAQEHWRLLGRSIAERGHLWLGSQDDIKKLVHIKSAINPADGTPRIYVGMHMVGIEAGLIGLSIFLNERGLVHPITLYVQMKNKFFDGLIKKWRERFGARMLLRRHNIRELLRDIRKGTFVLLSPDMDLGVDDSVFVPFFGVAACTVTSISRMAKMSGAEVVPVVTTLNSDGISYTCEIGQPWDAFPSEDIMNDIARMNQFFETQIRPRPAEYYWVHKRFKHRPPGEAGVY